MYSYECYLVSQHQMYNQSADTTKKKDFNATCANFCVKLQKLTYVDKTCANKIFPSESSEKQSLSRDNQKSLLKCYQSYKIS